MSIKHSKRINHAGLLTLLPLALAVANAANARIESVDLVGKVGDINALKIQVLTPNGGKIWVPRSYFKKDEVLAGAPVNLHLTQEQFGRLFVNNK